MFNIYQWYVSSICYSSDINYTSTQVLKLTALVFMVTMLLLLVALFLSSYREGSAASTMLLYQGESSALWWEWWLCPSTASSVSRRPLLPSSSLPWQVPHSILHLAAALLAESSPGQWVGLSPACLSNFLFPHHTSFQRVQRWVVPNLELFISVNSQAFTASVMSVVGILTITLLPAHAAACFWKIIGNWIMGKRWFWGDWWSKESSKRWTSGNDCGESSWLL